MVAFENIPQGLRDRPQWLCWVPSKDKAPRDLDGWPVSATDPKNWYSFQRVAKRPHGFCLTLDAGIIGIDFDGCIDDQGNIFPDVQRWLDMANSYAEISPSQQGLKLFVYGTLPNGESIKRANTRDKKTNAFTRRVPWGTEQVDHAGIELYANGRFFTVTGNSIPGCPNEIREAQQVINELVTAFAPPRFDRTQQKERQQAKTYGPFDFDQWVHSHNVDIVSPCDDGYIVRCPWSDEHSTPGDTARIYNTGDRYGFSCFHAHCSDRTWKNFRAHHDSGYAEFMERGYRAPDVQIDPPTAPISKDDQDVDVALLKFDTYDNGNAESMRYLYGSDFLFTPAYGWLMWTKTHWQGVPEAIVMRYAIATLKRRRIAAVKADNEAIVKATATSRDKVASCVALFKTYVIERNVGMFDADPDMLNCENGALNLRTGTLTPHIQSQRFTYCLSVPYDVNADMSVWQTFLRDALGQDTALVDYFQTCVGYSLTGHTREEKLFYLHGPTRAGKGTASETLLALLPRPLGMGVDFSSFTAKRDSDNQNFDLAELKPARLVVASESNRYQSLNPAKIKSLTGGDVVRCAFKHKDMFAYQPQFKVWLISNHQVNADPNDDAIWGRVQVFSFPNSHLGREDVTLKARLKSTECLAGVLRWAVLGAQLWYTQGRLTPPDAVLKETRIHRDNQDYIKQWIGEKATLAQGEWTPSAELLTSYREWCEVNDIKPLAPKDFAETLVTRFSCVLKRQAGTGSRGYTGIKMGVTPENYTDGGVTPYEPALQQGLPYDLSLGVTPVTSKTGEIAPRRGDIEKGTNQVSLVSRCHTPVMTSTSTVMTHTGHMEPQKSFTVNSQEKCCWYGCTSHQTYSTDGYAYCADHYNG